MSVRENQEMLLLQATRLRRTGRVSEAIAAYQQLLSLHPRLPDSWYNLAYLQRRAGQYEAALASYQQALDQGVRNPEEVYLNRAVIFADHLAKPDVAMRELRAALALNPNYVPALLNCGNLYEDCGERTLATEMYERVLALDPYNTLALSRLPQVRPVTTLRDPLIARLRQALARVGISAGDRANLGFGLGKALDDAASYDEAFAVYTIANRASRQHAIEGGVRYDPVAHERFIDELIMHFPKAAPLPTSEMSTDATLPEPIFICGMFRSGSTLVEQILSAHPQVVGGGEMELLPNLMNRHLVPFPRAMAKASSPQLVALARLYREGLRRLYPGAGMISDKRPDNFLYIGLIKSMFPRAKIIHTQRDPLDNCLSVFFLHLSHAMPYATELADIAHWYKQYLRLMSHWKSIYGAAIHDVRYDELVMEPESVIRGLLNYCDLAWDEACLSFHQVRNVVKTASVWQVRQPLYKKSSGRWRNYICHLDALRASLDLES